MFSVPIYIHHINRLRSGHMDPLFEATASEGLALASRYNVRLIGYWHTVLGHGSWPETVAVWELDDFSHYISVMKAQAEGADRAIQHWLERRSEWIASTESLLCHKSSLTPTFEEMSGRAMKAKLVVHEVVHTQPARQAEYLELCEEMWWRRVAEPSGRSLIGLYWSPWKNTVAINIWGRGEEWEEIAPMSAPKPENRDFQIWQTLGREVRTDWDDRFLLPAPFCPIR
jgi:hypothetical protein